MGVGVVSGDFPMHAALLDMYTSTCECVSPFDIHGLLSSEQQEKFPFQRATHRRWRALTRRGSSFSTLLRNRTNSSRHFRRVTSTGACQSQQQPQPQQPLPHNHPLRHHHHQLLLLRHFLRLKMWPWQVLVSHVRQSQVPSSGEEARSRHRQHVTSFRIRSCPTCFNSRRLRHLCSCRTSRLRQHPCHRLALSFLRFRQLFLFSSHNQHYRHNLRHNTSSNHNRNHNRSISHRLHRAGQRQWWCLQ